MWKSENSMPLSARRLGLSKEDIAEVHTEMTSDPSYQGCARDIRSSGRGSTGGESIWKESTATPRCDRVEDLTSTIQIAVVPPSCPRLPVPFIGHGRQG